MSLVGLISYDSDQDDAADTPIASVDNSFFGKSDDEATTTTMIIDRSNIGLEQSLKTAVTHEKKYPLLSMLPLVNATSATDIQQYEDFDLTNSLRAQKAFQNPYILTKVTSQLKIDEIGSNYPRDRFDPHGYNEKVDFEEAVRKRYSRAGQTVSAANAQQAATGGHKKKSRWDSTTADSQSIIKYTSTSK